LFFYKLKKIKALKGTILGTYEFMAPEVKNKNYDEKIDIFSMGITFCTLAFFQTVIPNNANDIYSKELINRNYPDKSNVFPSESFLKFSKT